MTGEPVSRWQPLAAQVEAGTVRLVRASWNRDFLDELAAAPDGPHDDQCAAAAGAFNKVCAVPTGAVPGSTPYPAHRHTVPFPAAFDFGGIDYAREHDLFGMGGR